VTVSETDLDDDLDGNTIPAGTAREVLEYIVRSVVTEPDEVEVEVDDSRRDRVSFNVRVGPDDMGRVIGRRGRIAQAIRTVVRAAASREDIRVEVEFLDD
jgi:predicted RNA-binding protein YlqC (UPF0109 family)